MRGYVEAAIARGDRTHVILRPGDPAEHLGHDRRGRRPALHGLHPAGRSGQLPRARALAARGGLGDDDLGEPLGITINIWAVVAPALMIGALTVSINVVADAIAGRLGRSIETEALRR